MTKMASRPHIWKENLQISPSAEPRGRLTLKLGIQQLVLRYFEICSNNIPGLTLTIFMTVKFVS